MLDRIVNLLYEISSKMIAKARNQTLVLDLSVLYYRQLLSIQEDRILLLGVEFYVLRHNGNCWGSHIL